MLLNVNQIDSKLSWSKGNKSAIHVFKFLQLYSIAYKTLTSHYPACFRYTTFSENIRIMTSTQRILCTIKYIIIPK